MAWELIVPFVAIIARLVVELTPDKSPKAVVSPEARRHDAKPDVRDSARITRVKVNILVHAALHDGVVTPSERSAIHDQVRGVLGDAAIENPDGLIDTLRLLHETLEPDEIEERIRELARGLDHADRVSLLATIERLARASDLHADGPYRSASHPPASDPLPLFRRALGLGRP
jgi:hypothetical protein